MNESFINVDGITKGSENVVKMINRAPLVYEKIVRTWLYSERNSFVGGSRKSQIKDGVFRKKLLRKKNSRGEGWSEKVVRLFKGEIKDIKSINMTLHMGVLYNNKKEMHTILESLGEDHTITSSKFMPVPIYKNLHVSALYKSYMVFINKIKKKELSIVRNGDSILYFNRTNDKYNPDRKKGELLFVGRRKIRVKKQFQFEADWMRRGPAVIERYYKAINKATKLAEKQVN